MTDRHLQSDGRVHGVAVACEGTEGRWLLIRRRPNVGAALAIAFPGGAVEAGETQAQAVCREMREELGVEVEPLACFWAHEFPDRPLTLFGWHARLLPGALVPDPREVEEILWLTPAEAAAPPDRTAQMTGYIEALGRYLQNG